MSVPIFIADAFTSGALLGNPAAVVLLSETIEVKGVAGESSRTCPSH